MSTSPTRIYSGIPYVLKQNGYTNLFFSTHNKFLDNLANFIPHNFFDSLYSSEVYPADKIIGPFGIADDYLFSYAINEFNYLPANKPFFATILTTSNHEPYIIPDYFKSSLKDKSYRAVSYADWSIGKFLNDAKQQKWFNNTVFVFVSDHGLNVGENPYEIALSYNHIPIIIYAPSVLKQSKVFDNFIGQIDVFPTLMGILNMDYINNTLGVDVLKTPRENIYFSADDKLACINNDYLFVFNYSGKEFLYKLGDKKNYVNEHKDILEKLRSVAYSQTQVSQWIYSNDKAVISE
jgi:phosphoglycerol transferase MdoB-like AlkP superfamily enzyme